MISIDKKNNSYFKSLVFFFLVFIIPIFVSYFFSIHYGYYNGDFMGNSVGLSDWQLLQCLIFSLLPFLYLYYLYTKRKGHDTTNFHHIKIKYFAFFSYSVEIFRLFIYYLFSKGFLSSLWIVTLLESVNPYPIIFVYFLISSNRLKYILLFLIALETYFRASFNGIYIIIGILIFNFSSSIFKFSFKKIISLIFLLYYLPTIILNLYILRSDLREIGNTQYYGNELVWGIFAGRFSSYPNLAYLMEDKVFTNSLSKNIPNTFYIHRTLSIYGIDLGDIGEIPEKSLYSATQNYSKESTTNSTSFMLGIPGILYLSYVKSLWVLILNIIFIIGVIKISFYITKSVRLGFVNEIVPFFLLLPILSGVSIELVRAFLSLLFLAIVYKISKKKQVKVIY